MKIKNIVLICFSSVFFILSSCNNEEAIESKYISNSRGTLEGFINDARNNVDFKDVVSKYYYKPNEIINDELYYRLFEAEYLHMIESLKKNNDSIYSFWNEEVRNMEYYDWLNADSFCKESALILYSKEYKSSEYMCFCFTGTGLIYSNLPLADSKDLASIVWLRNQKEFVYRKKGDVPD